MIPLKSTLKMVILMGLLTMCSASARDLAGDYSKALVFDPQYQTALADLVINQRTAKQSRSVFYPEATFSTQRIATDTSGRMSVNATQPLLDLERFVTYGQAEIQEALAEINLQVKQQDLASRFLKAATDITLAQEGLNLLEYKIKAIDEQLVRAKRMLQLGLGTVTDLRDIEVKLSQSRTEHLSLIATRSIAMKQYASMIGSQPVPDRFNLAVSLKKFNLQSLDQYTDLMLGRSPLINAAHLSLRLSESQADKIKASFLPVVNAQFAHTSSAGRTNSATYLGIGMSVPLKAGTVYGMQAALATVEKSREYVREVDSKSRLDIDKLRATIDFSNQSLVVQLEAIEAANLSVEANQKSYAGGVRNAIDVLNAIQIVYQLKSDYIKLAVKNANDILSLLLLIGEPSDTVVQKVNDYLFKG